MPNFCLSLKSIVTEAGLPSAGAGIAGPVTIRLPVGMVGGAVGPGNVPEDVMNIQRLLNAALPNVGIIQAPLVVDGKVGPKTLAAINAFQDSQMGFHDNVVQPGKTTLRRLNEVAGGAGGFGSMKQSALEAVPLAFSWLVGARASLAALNASNVKSPNNPNAVVLNKHFHFDRLANADAYLNKIRSVFSLSVRVLSNAAKFLQEGPGKGFADAPMGGFHLSNSPQFNHITIRAQFPPCGINARAAMLVHECAHFVGFVNEIRHFAQEFPAPDGARQDGSSHNYAQLTPDEATLNASSYAAYAIHAATGADSRFGLGNESI